MPARRRSYREMQIEDVAYELLEQTGFAETTMRNIATAARASNETLYKWYGDKLGLYRALIDRNAQIVARSLADCRHHGKRGMAALREVTPHFLETLLADRYVALNKAAVSDRTGSLAETLAASGRKAVLPMIRSLLQEAITDGELATPSGGQPDLDELLEAWATLTIGDLLALRLIGAMPAPSPAETSARAEQALNRLQTLYPCAQATGRD